ncbi:hypothetical protein K4K52_008909 [Colletotrichum sp. SAR 10_76]|nr:hypothetical protein K4K52_008909 [Colletotrichum sp. SAR 10_76]
MKPTTRLPLRLLAAGSSSSSPLAGRQCLRAISTTPLKPAEVAPVVGTGPPPAPPTAEDDRTAELRARVERRRRQAEMLKQATNIRAAADAKAGGAAARAAGLKRRFWNDVSVHEVDGTHAFFFPRLSC